MFFFNGYVNMHQMSSHRCRDMTSMGRHRNDICIHIILIFIDECKLFFLLQSKLIWISVQVGLTAKPAQLSLVYFMIRIEIVVCCILLSANHCILCIFHDKQELTLSQKFNFKQLAYKVLRLIIAIFNNLTSLLSQ